MAFADILEQVGSTGRFQVIHFTLLCLPILMLASHNLLQNFVALVPPHYCRAPENLSTSHLDARQLLLITIPVEANGQLSRCQRYSSPQWHVLDANTSSAQQDPFSDELQGCEEGWEYNNTEMSSTIISEWNLVCDLRSLKQMAQTIYMGGVLVGAVVVGALSDSYGRRLVLLFSNLLMAVAGTCTAFAPSFSLYCFFRFLCGMALSGIVLNGFALIVEWIPIRVRTVVGTASGYCYTLGQIVLAGLAYCIPNWRWLTLAVSLPFCVAFLYCWWILESARWLVLKGKTKQAVKSLRKVAQINGRKAEGEKIDVELLQESMRKEIASSQGSYTTLNLFRTPVVRFITFCLSLTWFSISFAYYGIAMDLQKFGVSIYLIQVIFGAVDIPAKVLMTFFMMKIGRRPSLCVSMVLAGTIILVNLLVPYEMQTLRTVLAVLGKGFLAAAFNSCYLYSGELYPTVIRQSGMGWVSMMARVGAMVAPMVQLLGEAFVWLPGLIYGGVPIICGVFSSFLPETLGVPLPDTIQDVEEKTHKKDHLSKEEERTKDTTNSLLKETI